MPTASVCDDSTRAQYTAVPRLMTVDARIDGSAWIAWRLLFGRGPWRQGSRPLRGGEAALDAMVRVQNLVAHAIQALLPASHPAAQEAELPKLCSRPALAILPACTLFPLLPSCSFSSARRSVRSRWTHIRFSFGLRAAAHTE